MIRQRENCLGGILVGIVLNLNLVVSLVSHQFRVSLKNGGTGIVTKQCYGLKMVCYQNKMKITNKKIAKHKSSVAWLSRQAADPYVARAHRDGYRARAAYKLIEINEKYKFLKNGQTVVDLGAAPGSWSQFIARTFPKTKIFAMDLLEITPINNVEFYQGDFTTDAALRWLTEKLKLDDSDRFISYKEIDHYSEEMMKSIHEKGENVELYLSRDNTNNVLKKWAEE